MLPLKSRCQMKKDQKIRTKKFPYVSPAHLATLINLSSKKQSITTSQQSQQTRRKKKAKSKAKPKQSSVILQPPTSILLQPANLQKFRFSGFLYVTCDIFNFLHISQKGSRCTSRFSGQGNQFPSGYLPSFHRNSQLSVA